MIYSQASGGFAVRMVVGDVMYLSPAQQGLRPELQALRLDAGATTPSAIVESTLHGISSIGVSGTYVYWDWTEQQISGVMTSGLSRAPLAGGSEEDVVPLPFGRAHLAVVGEDVYALEHPSLEADDYNIAITRISTVSHIAETIFSEPKGTGREGWFGAYRDHILWSDLSAAPPKVYEIRGSTLQLDASVRCAPYWNAVLSGDVIVSHDYLSCAANSGIVITATNLDTGQLAYFTSLQFHDLDVGSVVGARDGWIYMTGTNSLYRIRPEPL
jgi:hypothetical protein